MIVIHRISLIDQSLNKFINFNSSQPQIIKGNIIPKTVKISAVQEQEEAPMDNESPYSATTKRGLRA